MGIGGGGGGLSPFRVALDNFKLKFRALHNLSERRNGGGLWEAKSEARRERVPADLWCERREAER